MKTSMQKTNQDQQEDDGAAVLAPFAQALLRFVVEPLVALRAHSRHGVWSACIV